MLLVGHPRLEANMEEARRLYYVGMTRAMDRLFLCCAESHPFVDEVGSSVPEWVSMQAQMISLALDEEREARTELWEMQLDDVHLSFPAWKYGQTGTTAAIDALQTVSGELRLQPWGQRLRIYSNDVPVCTLSAKGGKKYKEFLDRGLQVEKIYHLASIHRSPSEQDLAGGWIDPERFPSWHVPLFQVIWRAKEGAV